MDAWCGDLESQIEEEKKKDIEINEWTCLPFTLPIFSGSLNSFNKSLIEEYGK